MLPNVRDIGTEVIGAPFTTRSGDSFDLLGHQMIVGETEWRSGFGRYVTAWLLPPLLYVAKVLEWKGRIEGRRRPLTAEPLPCHDPPVAWRVESGLWGFCRELPLIACPALLYPAVVPVHNLPEEIPVLDHEPGRRP